MAPGRDPGRSNARGLIWQDPSGGQGCLGRRRGRVQGKILGSGMSIGQMVTTAGLGFDLPQVDHAAAPTAPAALAPKRIGGQRAKSWKDYAKIVSFGGPCDADAMCWRAPRPSKRQRARRLFGEVPFPAGAATRSRMDDVESLGDGAAAALRNYLKTSTA